jgi:hypothetical protein
MAVSPLICGKQPMDSIGSNLGYDKLSEPPHTDGGREHLNRFLGGWNYPQAGGTRPCVAACQEEYVWTPVFVTSAPHHALVWSYHLTEGGSVR